MLKNLPALRKLPLCLVFSAALFLFGPYLPAEDPGNWDQTDGEILTDTIRWYRSNASGMTLEMIPSRLAALRNEYCLSVETVSRSGLPNILFPYYDELFKIELRILFEKGSESRRQWLFRDSRNLARLTASGSGGLFGGDSSGEDEEKRKGFIEIRDDKGFLVRELRFEDDLSEWEFSFHYHENTLLRAETWFKEAPAPPPPEPSAQETPESEEAENAAVTEEEKPPDSSPSFALISTDYYRYSRFGSIRAIERVFHEGARLARTSFPRIEPDLSYDEELAIQGIAYSSEFLLDINSPEGTRVSYSLDNRGRILSEIWKNEDGEVLGEFRNVWSSDRLQSVLWRAKDDERLIEYEYDDDGNRIVERNLRRGVLERSVTSRDGRETEEIYRNGRLVLRAFWEKGMKISEERVSGGEPRR